MAADEFDDNRLQLLRAHDVRRTIVGIRHRINNEAGENGIRRTALQSSIDDVREFDRALANLGRTGWRDESQRDAKVALEVLSRLGILARSGVVDSSRGDQ